MTSSDSPQTVTIVNNGNAALAFSALAPSSNNFSLTGSACSIANPVAAGLSCALALSFTPQSVGSLTGAAVLTDNSLQPSATQSVTLTGTGTIGSQTITFAGPGSQMFGAPLTLTATASSGLLVGFSSSTPGVCTVASGTVTFLSIGNCSITASQPGNANYTAASAVTRIFSVVPGTPTITFSVPAQTFGAAPFTVAATSNSTGAITYSLVSGPATVSGNTVTLTGVGTVVLLATQAAAGNFLGSTQSVSVTVLGALPAITFTVAAQTFGASPFLVVATSNSPGTITYSVVSGPATLSGNTVTLTGPGTVVLLASQAATANYSAASQTATFTVTSSTPTVTATISPANPVYGQAATITVTETAAGSTVAGATATVTVGGQIYTCATNASGVCAVTVPGSVLSGGSNPVTVSTAAVGSVTAGAFQFTVTVGPAPTTLTLGSSSTQITVDNPVTLTATVASVTPGAPTGSVIFYANGTSIGTATVTGGVASLTLSTLAVGANAISATYSGDSNFLASMASGFTQTVVVNFTISPGTGSGAAPPVQTVQPGGTAVFPLSLGIINGFVGSVTMSATGLPPGATVTFTPTVILLDGIHPGNTSMSVTTSAPVADAVPDAKLPGSRIRYGWVLLPMLALGGLRKRRMSWTSLVMLGVCGLGISGCWSGGYFGAAPSSYVITVTASSGQLQHSTTVTLTIQ